MPLGSSRILRNPSSLELPNISMSTNESVPKMTAQLAMAMTMGPLDWRTDLSKGLRLNVHEAVPYREWPNCTRLFLILVKI